MIQSKDSATYKKIKKLQEKRFRDQENQFLVYGEHLIDKAQQCDAIIEIYTTNPLLEGTLISKPLMKDLSLTETPYERLAICKKVNLPKTSDYVLLLDDVQDPDNVGALMRSGVAFGFKHMIVSEKTADVYNDKVIRASKGAIFDCYVERINLQTALLSLKKQGYHLIGADAHQSSQMIPKGKIALVLGNEARGISPEVKTMMDFFYTIKTEQVESLNVSVAGAIMMYTIRGQL